MYARPAAVVAGVAEPAQRRGDVEAEASDGVGQVSGLLLRLHRPLGHQVLDDGEEELVLAGEVAIEGLEGDARLLHQLLGRELALRSDQPASGVDDEPRLLQAAGLGSLHQRRPVGSTLSPGHR